jgi:hypothetical protein
MTVTPDTEEEKMMLIHRRQVQVLTAVQIVGILAFTSFATLSPAEEASVEAIKAGIEGVYVLQEWHRTGRFYALH